MSTTSSPVRATSRGAQQHIAQELLCPSIAKEVADKLVRFHDAPDSRLRTSCDAARTDSVFAAWTAFVHFVKQTVAEGKAVLYGVRSFPLFCRVCASREGV